MRTKKKLPLATQFPAVSFGTSGVRALVDQLTPDVISSYVYAFVSRMKQTGNLFDNGTVVVGMDLRPSSPKIAQITCATLRLLGFKIEFVGALPTPALALHCINLHAPGIMITGSHIPFDRNGIKFYGAKGEILKEDEQAILDMPAPDGFAQPNGSLPPIEAPSSAREVYIQRYINYFGETALRGLRVGLYEHSAVGRELTREVLEAMGATVFSLGRSNDFVPIDTEAVREEDIYLARNWCHKHQLDALVSTDGDGDRPLVFDGQGNFIRGDLLGLICAKSLGIRALAIPISCNTSIETANIFKRVVRTRIGSPFVIDGMNTLIREGEDSVAGFEANGGFILGTALPGMSALPTRDALLPMIATLATAAQNGQSLTELVAKLPARFTHSDRIKNISREISFALLSRIIDDLAFQKEVFPEAGQAVAINTTDGVRLTFLNGDIAHLRPSGNAPELRCYTESETFQRAKFLCEKTLELLA